MIVDEIYHTLKETDNTLSVSRFCVDYLDTSRGYLFNRRSKDKDVSAEVLLNLYGNLKKQSDLFLVLAKDNARPTHWVANWQHKASMYDNLASGVLTELTSRSLH